MHEGHRQRMKARFLKEGIDSFETHEVLELLLFYAIPRSNTNTIAHELIREFGSLSRVFEANPADLTKVEGVSSHSAVLIHMIPALTRIYNQDKWGEKPTLQTSQLAGEFATSLLVGRPQETLIMICLNKQKKVLNWKVINEGDAGETILSQRLIVEEALLQNAQGIILAHNHPSGSLKPSYEDQIATRSICHTLQALHMELIDHFIVAGNDFVGMGDLNML